jgi:signal transduction histidine kinase/CheY-like chemotaxis protein/HPt (histidine-containing phosphotransfer) domain-containing protein
MSQKFKSGDALVVRWIALAGAGGAAIASGFAHSSNQQVWQSVALILALLGVAGIAGLWYAMARRNEALLAASEQTHEQKREVTALNEELAVHRELEKELTVAKQAAESAMMAKGEFLATMSHEIRTPLNGIIPMLDIMMSVKLAPDHHDILRTAYTSARQMLRIVDDILDYSKLEANKLQLETTSFNLREVCDSIIMLMEKPAESKGLRLNLQLDSSVRLPVRGDPVRLRQVLTNLISNAVKFTERGSVTLHISRRGETTTQHELRIEVRDTGIGISPQGVQQLFRPFSQADTSTTRLYGGTGLGLVICKRIVDLMGGTIGVESESGRGSTFWVELPLLKAPGDMRAQRMDLNGSRVLLLSNDALFRQRIQQAAATWGCQITETDTTQDALTRLRTALTRGNTWTFDLLLVDMNSVRSTAIALHRNLRRAPDLEGLRVVYFVGNDPLPDELNDGPLMLSMPRAMQANEMRTSISNFLSKPVIQTEVLEESFGTASNTMPSAVSAATPATTASVQPVKKLRGHLLLVEDNPVNLMVAQRLIGLLGLNCETADNGEKALERMMSGHLDLVLMDCQMPVKDGYTATREWRQHELNAGLPRLPIIAMTANAMAGDRQKCLDAGMDDYISKPVDRRLLESSLARWLKVKQEQGNLVKDTAFVSAPVSPLHDPSAASVSTPVALPRPTMTPNIPSALPSRPEAPSAPAALPPRPVAAPPSIPSALPPRPAIAPGIPSALPPRPTMAPSAPVIPAQSPSRALPPRPMAPTNVTANTTSAPVISTRPALAPVGVESPTQNLPVLAPEVLEELEAVMGGEYMGLIKLFLEDAPKQIQQLEQAAAENNIHGMIAPAHTLKSSSANLGALALSAIAKRIEIGARGNALNRPTVAVVMLEAEYKKAQNALLAKLR